MRCVIRFQYFMLQYFKEMIQYTERFHIWLQVKMRGPDQPPKPTGDPDPRSRPAIQTDPDLTIQTDPDLTIQTYDPDPFVLCWLDIFFKVLNSTTLYYKVLKSTSLYYKVRSWVIS